MARRIRSRATRSESLMAHRFVSRNARMNVCVSAMTRMMSSSAMSALLVKDEISLATARCAQRRACVAAAATKRGRA